MLWLHFTSTSVRDALEFEEEEPTLLGVSSSKTNKAREEDEVEKKLKREEDEEQRSDVRIFDRMKKKNLGCLCFNLKGRVGILIGWV